MTNKTTNYVLVLKMCKILPLVTFNSLILPTELCVLHWPWTEDRQGEGCCVRVHHSGPHLDRARPVRPGQHQRGLPVPRTPARALPIPVSRENQWLHNQYYPLGLNKRRICWWSKSKRRIPTYTHSLYIFILRNLLKSVYLW